MSLIQSHNRFSTLASVLIPMLFISLALSYAVLVNDMRQLYDENALMEHVQLLLLAITAVVFWRADWCELDEVSWQQRKQLRLLAMTATALSVSFFIRELSVKAMGLDGLEYWVDGRGFKLLMAALWLPLLVLLWRQRRLVLALVVHGFSSGFAIFAVLAALSLVGGGIFDKEILKPEYFRFYEELLEMNGYGLLLISALLFRCDIKQALLAAARQSLSFDTANNKDLSR